MMNKVLICALVFISLYSKKHLYSQTTHIYDGEYINILGEIVSISNNQLYYINQGDTLSKCVYKKFDNEFIQVSTIKEYNEEKVYSFFERDIKDSIRIVFKTPYSDTLLVKFISPLIIPDKPYKISPSNTTITIPNKRRSSFENFHLFLQIYPYRIDKRLDGKYYGRLYTFISYGLSLEAELNDNVFIIHLPYLNDSYYKTNVINNEFIHINEKFLLWRGYKWEKTSRNKTSKSNM